ncbi:hypothetical protein ACROYT_G036181 [Oculina patagonica]
MAQGKKYWFLVAVFCVYCISTAKTSNELQKKYISDPDAICNDNSRAAFYIRPQSRKKWVVFFESGGFCASFEDCNERYSNKNSTMFMTSNILPDEITGRDLLSASKHENPTFSEYTHVLVPYCSSDLWLGLKTNPKEPFHFVNDSSVDNFSFRGHTIFRSVFHDLLQQYNLSDAEEIILSGSSAGGIGVLNHADWVLNNVIKSRGMNCKLLSIVDSAWFIDFQGSLQAQVNPKFLSFANISLSACMDFSHGHTCCPSASCMISRGYYPSSVPLFFVSSMYDSFLLRDAFKRLEDEGKTADENFGDFLSVVNMYGGEVNGSVTITNNEVSNVSFFIPACFQHVYFVTSSLWDENGVLPPSFEVAAGSGKFRNRIQSGTWESVQIVTGANSTSIRDFITTWVKSRDTSMRMTDTCIGAQCNPTCPRQLLFTDPAVDWGPTIETIVIVLSLVITVTCFGLKSVFMFYQYYLARKQKQFLNDPETSLTESELPPCRPNEIISIACFLLSYSVDVAKKTKKDKGDTAIMDEEIQKEPTESAIAAKRNNKAFSVVLEDVIVEEDSSMDSSDSQSTDQEKRLQPKPPPTDDSVIEFSSKKSLVHFPTVKNGLTNTTVPLTEIDKKSDAKRERFIDPSKESLHVDCHTLDKKPKRKQILKNVSVYFNPGELVAIMGPSGCGKTTLLDLLTGRRRQGYSRGHVYINGVSMDAGVQDWYSRKIGYVLQLAVPYYEELTVRQNLFFAAHMRLPKSMSHSRKFERVEQILAETGLTSLADTVVGGSVGQGLSGGQKRRLCVALQMINLPSVLFLDEPTSGLDASSSLELLNHLNLVAESGRLVILTIHQPRLEIFHLFHKILLLCDGQVAYYGDPTVAPSIFLKAYIQSTTEEFRRSEDAPNIDAKNPADTIMDLLNCSQARRFILDYYQSSGEPQAVQEAIKTSQRQDRNALTLMRMKNEKKDVNGAGSFNRIFVLEGRTSVRQTLGQITYFPLIFFTFGLIIGTVYWQAEEKDGILLMSAYCIYTVSSPLFLSAILMAHLNKALNILRLERADGCGRSHENVIQTYVRTAALCVIPVLVCSVMTYFMVMTSYDLWKFVLVTIISLVLNQTWIAVYMMVICAHPGIAHRICPMVSAFGGFSGGFIVPRPAMPPGYNLLFYINPVFYGFSAITKVLLQDVQLKCENDSKLNCISTNGNAVLARFGFDTVNIYENLAIMLGMTVLSLILSWVFLEMKHIKTSLFTKKSSTFYKEDEVLEVSVEPLHKSLPVVQTARRKSTLGIITEDEGFHTIKHPEDYIKTIPEEEDTKHESEPRISRKQSSRKVRWQSVRKRMNEKRESAELQIKDFHRITKQYQVNLNQNFGVSRKRSTTFPVIEESTPNTTRRRNLSLGDTVSTDKVFDLAAVTPQAEQEDRKNIYQDTRF